jgi:hypothetical protein
MSVGEKSLIIPEESQENCIGYFGVEVAMENKEATISQFIRPSQTFNKEDSSDLNNFLEHLEKLDIGKNFLLNSQKFQECMEQFSVHDILVNLERIQRTYPKNRWADVGFDFLLNCYKTEEVTAEYILPYLPQRDISQNEKDKLKILAANLLDDLNSVWSKPENKKIKLSDWFKDIANILETGWLTLEVFKHHYEVQLNLGELRLATAYRSRRENCDRNINKRIATKELNNGELDLIINLQQDDEYEIDIIVQLIPLKSATFPYLSKEISLSILDEEENLFLQAISGQDDHWLQLQFRGVPGDAFVIQVKEQDFEFKEEFEF